MNTVKLRSMLKDFYNEDIGDRDITSESLFSSVEIGELTFITKQSGVFCGEDIIREGYRTIDSTVEVNIIKNDGSFVDAGDIIAIARGSVQNILKGERVILNLIQRMSGIATLTANAMKCIKGTGTRVCDTRKTMPGIRMLDKYAVVTGGGVNHRNGLYDAVMIKDNHISFAGSIENAIRKVREKIGHTVKIEVEIESKEQLIEAVEHKADIIMFDNCTPDQIKNWLSLVPDWIATEASGNITLDNLLSYANTGVQYISLGCLTHSVSAFDISARVKINNEI
ncbi:carboxylating nicotinate-nucleotide diphosphorylase [Heyndrickxia vini]|uniref:nicotinate-nucleotide diphosphorylase (carboxylating) n=1 Tax=Heyndrickxia vini TaxID=1476025 RepID=A0ABX7E662_9BACI|nr:carboxylating nicotinate-nucleotide diphosphorylase [Heyndrickxia vini]QQZ10735.1 carboxylating nicotinate-nucleotide diphosphorylase [Heyndrickxia vini]